MFTHTITVWLWQLFRKLMVYVKNLDHQKKSMKPFSSHFTAYWKFLDSWVHQKWQLTISGISPHYRLKENYWLQPAFKTPGYVIVFFFSLKNISIEINKATWVNILTFIIEGIYEKLRVRSHNNEELNKHCTNSVFNNAMNYYSGSKSYLILHCIIKLKFPNDFSRYNLCFWNF